MMSTNLSPCPICSKEFPVENIEIHVDKCIFLSSEAGTSKRASADATHFLASTPKRLKSVNITSPQSVKNVKTPKPETNVNIPLAEKMRPSRLEDFVGQEHILSENKALKNLLEADMIPSMILWGPPGCGKTSLAHIIQKRSQTMDIRFVKLSATQTGVNDVKEIIKVAKNESNLTKRKTILFMDEIHRFNKLQQDIFLPNVENGLITLIGATTENPSFSLNSALLSRCKVFVLEKLKVNEIEKLLIQAAKLVEALVPGCNDTQISHQRFKVTKETLTWLAEMCDGDARIALNSFQMALESTKGKEILLDNIKEGIKKSHLLYDRKGEEHYNIISALHKSIRASDDNAALYWLARMLEGGEDPLFIARRLVRAASEDIGLANPLAVSVAVSAMQGCQLIGMPECDVLLAQTAVFLARSNKSTETYKALLKAKECIKNHKGPLPSVPLHLRNAPTSLMKDLGYAKGYNMAHKGQSGLNYMPEGMESLSFFPENEEDSED